MAVAPYRWKTPDSNGAARFDTAARDRNPMHLTYFLLALCLGTSAIYFLPTAWLAPAFVVVVHRVARHAGQLALLKAL